MSMPLIAAGLAAALLGAGALVAATAVTPGAAPLTAAPTVNAFDEAALAALPASEQAAMRAMVRKALVENPEILTEASLSLDNKRAAEMASRIAAHPDDMSVGPANAPITVVEFFDYACGFCHAANDWVWSLIGSRTDVRVVFKELPILSEESYQAARAGAALKRQGQKVYLAYHRRMMQHRGALSMQVIEAAARDAGADLARMRREMQDPAITDMLQRVSQEAQAANVRGTPGFFINGRFVGGFNQQQLDQLIAEAAPKRG
jgi:protein-disulfide isomerase